MSVGNWQHTWSARKRMRGPIRTTASHHNAPKSAAPIMLVNLLNCKANLTVGADGVFTTTHVEDKLCVNLSVCLCVQMGGWMGVGDCERCAGCVVYVRALVYVCVCVYFYVSVGMSTNANA